MRVLWEYLFFCNLFSLHSFVKFYFHGTITYSKKESNTESDGFLFWLHGVFFFLLNCRLAQFYFKSLPRFALLFYCLFHLQSICPFWHNLPHVVVCLLPLIIGKLSNTLVVEHRKGCWTRPCIVNVDCKDFELCYVW